MNRRPISAFAILTVFVFCSTAVTPQSQPGMSRDACEEYTKSYAGMNKVYNRILAEYKGDPLFIERLKKAQRAWLAFRHAHLESIYPDPDPTAYGSVNTVCQCRILEELTTRRTKELQRWIDGTKEGDVCAGSVKWKK